MLRCGVLSSWLRMNFDEKSILRLSATNRGGKTVLLGSHRASSRTSQSCGSTLCVGRSWRCLGELSDRRWKECCFWHRATSDRNQKNGSETYGTTKKFYKQFLFRQQLFSISHPVVCNSDHVLPLRSQIMETKFTRIGVLISELQSENHCLTDYQFLTTKKKTHIRFETGRKPFFTFSETSEAEWEILI